MPTHGLVSHRRCRQGIIPDYLLRNLAESDQVEEAVRDAAIRTLEQLESFLKRIADEEHANTEETELRYAAAYKDKTDPPRHKPQRSIHDAKNSFSESDLPGKLVRGEGDEPVDDKAVNQAFENVGKVLAFFKEHFNWHSMDDKNMDVVSTVHFGEKWENAFWDPERLQMVFGDGDTFLNNFTGCVDVIGHELTHAVTEFTSPLDYWGLPGALNEHISDVFGIMIKQKAQDEDAENADWLIGEDCILPDVKGTALRSMKAPGHAYDDSRFGKDPQVAHMDDYKTMFEDNGGVHIYSGIPNKAFYLASVAFGGYSWEKAGKIWWRTMNSGKIPPKCDFKKFAQATIEVAMELDDDKEADGKKTAAQIVRKAWQDVGVLGDVEETDESCVIL